MITKIYTDAARFTMRHVVMAPSQLVHILQAIKWMRGIYILLLDAYFSPTT